MSKFLRPEVKQMLMKKGTKSIQPSAIENHLTQLLSASDRVSQDLDIQRLYMDEKFNSFLLGFGRLSEQTQALQSKQKILMVLQVASILALIASML